MKHVSFLLLVCIPLLFSAQIFKKDSTYQNEIKLEALPYYNYGKGLGLTSPDSIFQFNIRFRMQNRVAYHRNEGADPIIDAQIRRLRLRFDGYVGSPKFMYVIQLGFSGGDVGATEDGENLDVIRDAAIIYRPNKHWNFVFGQTKLPGNRQRINSSGALQLTDRSINNARFTIDRDFGLQANFQQANKDKFSYAVKSAISTGEGRNFTKNNDDNLAYTGKIELFPFGTFTNEGIYFEGDIVREKKPKLMVSAGFSQNNFSKKTQGQLGDYLYEPKTSTALFLDAMLKYKGFAAMASYMNRNTLRNPMTNSEPDENGIIDQKFVWIGEGKDVQMSYLFLKNYEIIGRFSTQMPYKEIEQFVPKINQISLGLTKYLWEHALKFQTEFTYETQEFLSTETKNNWYIRFQIEIGI